MIGRGLRPCPGEGHAVPADWPVHLRAVKDDCLVSDLVDICSRHSLMHVPSLVGREPEHKVPASPPLGFGREAALELVSPMPLAAFEAIDIVDPALCATGPMDWFTTPDGWGIHTYHHGYCTVSRRWQVTFGGAPHCDRQCTSRLDAFQYTDQVFRTTPAAPPHVVASTAPPSRDFDFDAVYDLLHDPDRRRRLLQPVFARHGLVPAAIAADLQ
jgi:hypothetical protein